MQTIKVGDIVTRVQDGSYDLTKSNKILKEHFNGISYASTLAAISPIKVEFVDQFGALVSYDQENYSNRGYLYYPYDNLTRVKQPEDIINEYPIY